MSAFFMLKMETAAGFFETPRRRNWKVHGGNICRSKTPKLIQHRNVTNSVKQLFLFQQLKFLFYRSECLIKSFIICHHQQILFGWQKKKKK
jgi:hypothetical protein